MSAILTGLRLSILYSLITIFALVAQTANAVRSSNSAILLFKDRNTPVKNYRGIVENLQEGQSIKFSDRSIFVVKQYLGKDGLDYVLLLEDGSKLLLPIDPKDNRVNSRYSTREEGLAELQQYGVKTVKPLKLLPGQHLWLSAIDERWTLEEFLTRYSQLKAEGKELPNHQLQAVQDLFRLSRDLRHFEALRGLSPANVIFSYTHGWVFKDAGTHAVLFDWNNGKLDRNRKGSSIFAQLALENSTHTPPLQQLLKELDAFVASARRNTCGLAFSRKK